MLFTNNSPAINMTMVGFGQAGTRMADVFAGIKKNDGTPVYNCLALNSNDGDLKGLKNIPASNQVSLDLGGLGKNPEKAMRILDENGNAKEKLKQFITERVRPSDDLVLFFAGLGGGTGTSTIIKAIEEFNDFHNKPIIKEELIKIQKKTDPAEFKNNLKKYMAQAVKNAEEKSVKIGVVVTLPVREDGPDVLRQVNDFTQTIWKLAKDKSKGIAFVIFADNQKFADEFDSLPDNIKHGLKIDNYRDYSNIQIRNVIHELNTATTGGGTSVTFDKEDFKRVILEHQGCLVINRIEADIQSVNNEHDIKKMFTDSIKDSLLHEPVQLVEKQENGELAASKVHHLGLLAVISPDKKIPSSFMDQSKKAVIEEIPLSGTVFNGYLEEKNNRKAIVYTFFKTEGLPSRLVKGLVEEYKEYREKQQKFAFKNSSIESIAATIEEDDNFDFDMDIDLSDLGIVLDGESTKEEVKKDEEHFVDIDALDFDNID
ncbi:cell division protein FtsZ [Robertmurraya yapensis]|uniref:Cell division protein FtsZ n=2 Tax=Bacillaceae TaxID=186817 RepID=A0A431VYF0_9BACI|nr:MULTISPECIES: cell division protein FtsZ [Bacillaceae]RTR28116.1 cell division protein FtsZ [Bacillus yapensis]TKC15163.1 cell division protein FtsZ [Robertmurraya kyonggiensis]TKS94358.1 cell division protein FtsZ [Bacillus yapensis]